MPGMHVGRHTERCRGARVVQCRSLLDTAGRDAVLAEPEGGWDGCPGWGFVRCSGRRTRWDWIFCWEGGAVNWVLLARSGMWKAGGWQAGRCVALGVFHVRGPGAVVSGVGDLSHFAGRHADTYVC